jgi:20S proteasome subunit alpha 7
MTPDGRNLVSRAKLEASSYLKTYGIPISGKILTERLSIYVHAHTCHWGARPFGCCVMISSFENGAYHLYMLETSGNFYEYYSCTHGKGRQYVKSAVEKDNFAIRNKSINEGIEDALRILLKSYEGERETEYDAGIISFETNGKHKLADKNVIKNLVQKIRSEAENKMEIDK